MFAIGLFSRQIVLLALLMDAGFRLLPSQDDLTDHTAASVANCWITEILTRAWLWLKNSPSRNRRPEGLWRHAGCCLLQKSNYSQAVPLLTGGAKGESRRTRNLPIAGIELLLQRQQPTPFRARSLSILVPRPHVDAVNVLNAGFCYNGCPNYDAARGRLLKCDSSSA